MPLQYVVMTMVDRDDLLDGGAGHVAVTVRRLKELRPEMLVETLVGDFGGHLDPVDVTIDARPDVWAHNIEVVRRLQRTIRDVRCGYEQSLRVLARVKERAPGMVGIGESDDEVLETMSDLRAVGVDIVTLGQYLRPTPKHAPVDRYVDPSRFEEFERQGKAMGFAYVASGPLVRSSYKAAEVFIRTILQPGSQVPDALLRDGAGDAATGSASEVAARHAATLLPARRLVRR
jgi:lipoic acid synthetase